MRIAADYHTHTIHSHGTGTVLDNLKAAAAKGLKEVAISDHGPANLFGIGTKGIDTFRQIRAEMEAAAQLVPNVRGLLGVEANILSVDGRLDISEEDLEIFDVVQRDCIFWLIPVPKGRTAADPAMSSVATSNAPKSRCGTGTPRQ